MKNGLISGILFIILGLAIALGPQTIFPICGSGGVSEAAHASPETGMVMGEKGGAPAMSSPMKCFWTGRAELGIGTLISILGLLLLLLRDKKIRLGLSLAIFLNGLLALLVPTVLIGVCSSAHMDCRKLALPALLIFSGFVIAFSIVNIIYLYKSDRGGKAENEAQAADRHTPVESQPSE